MRLADGKTELEGRLELCIGGRWGTVGSEGWHQTNSEVVCNSFGYNISGQYRSQCMGDNQCRDSYT